MKNTRQIERKKVRTKKKLENQVIKIINRNDENKSSSKMLVDKIESYKTQYDYNKKEYCENCNGVLGFDCTYVIPKDENSKGILTVEHWDGNPDNNQPDNLLTLCGNCARYKTNLFEDWKTPGRNLKRVQGRNWVEPIDFIWKDWVGRINQPNFEKLRNLINIIVGLTGQGKTLSITKYMIPEFKKKGVRLIIVSAPQSAILDIRDFKKAGQENDYIHEDNTIDALEALEDGDDVILTLTHSGLISSNGRKLLKYCKDNNIKHSIIIDEAHTWLCTSAENYKKTVGHLVRSTEYSATLFNLLSEVSEYNSYIFGLTATPNNEQNGKVKINGTNTSFEIINKMCPLEIMVSKQAWVDEITYLDLTDIDSVYFTIKNRIHQITQEYNQTGVKKALLISCSVSGYDSPYEIDKVLQVVQDTYLEMGLDSDYRIAEMRTGNKDRDGHTKKINYLHSANGSVKKDESEKSLKRALNDDNDPCSVLLVVNKGSMGMNVRKLGGLIVLKKTDKDDGEGYSLTEFARQIMGRLVRINTRISSNEFANKYEYDFAKYWLSLDKEQRQNAIISNSFFMDVPDNSMWRDAVELFITKYVNSVEFATESLNELV